jgi:inosine-uridine nucleoside N-ribohydrolase
MAARRMKVLLDTDIGSDIDDAVCLAYLLAEARCELVGITTVTGEATKRAMLASALCKVAGKSVPIYPGSESPLVIGQKQPEAPQAAALSRWPHDTEFPLGEAVEFLRRTIRNHPGEVTLLTIGPLTNIAHLFRIDPEIPTLLGALVMMCGVFTDADPKRVEWNAACDPHAAAIVYDANVRVHRSIGLDVTMQVQMERPEVRRRFETPLLRPVLDFAEVWFKTADRLTFHDPLAAVTIFDDEVCRFRKGTVGVELGASVTVTSGNCHAVSLGRTIWTPGGSAPRHEVALSVSPARFFDHYFSTTSTL